MQLVIDIPEEEYRWIKQSNNTAAAALCSKECMMNAIKNGMPLPEGHGRLIDADDCKKNKRDFCEKSTRTNWYVIIDDLLDEAPTIIQADSSENA